MPDAMLVDLRTFPLSGGGELVFGRWAHRPLVVAFYGLAHLDPMNLEENGRPLDREPVSLLLRTRDETVCLYPARPKTRCVVYAKRSGDGMRIHAYGHDLGEADDEAVCRYLERLLDEEAQKNRPSPPEG